MTGEIRQDHMPRDAEEGAIWVDTSRSPEKTYKREGRYFIEQSETRDRIAHLAIRCGRWSGLSTFWNPNPNYREGET